jgi:PEP-CTERM motif-containing protein
VVIRSVFLLCLTALLSGTSHAAIVTYKASGHITSASFQSGTIGIGDAFDLYYRYDTDSSDSDPSEIRGLYELQSMFLDIESYEANTVNNPGGRIFVDNGIWGYDVFTLNSGFYSHAAPLIGDRELISIVSQYMDADADAFDSDALPSTPLDINEFESARLEMLFSNNWQPGVAFDAQWIYGDITSVSVAPVPEPEIYAMMGVGLGVMGWVARRKKMKLTVET